jgi:hypothetical protein
MKIKIRIHLGPLISRCPPGFIRGLEDTEVILGKSITLECQFFGIPEVDLQWYKDGGPLDDDNDDRLVFDIIDDVATLTITNATPDDQAWYRCNAYNDLGSASTDCELVVVEIPTFVKSLEDTIISEGKSVRL